MTTSTLKKNTSANTTNSNYMDSDLFNDLVGVVVKAGFEDLSDEEMALALQVEFSNKKKYSLKVFEAVCRVARKQLEIRARKLKEGMAEVEAYMSEGGEFNPNLNKWAYMIMRKNKPAMSHGLLTVACAKLARKYKAEWEVKRGNEVQKASARLRKFSSGVGEGLSRFTKESKTKKRKSKKSA